MEKKWNKTAEICDIYFYSPGDGLIPVRTCGGFPYESLSATENPRGSSKDDGSVSSDREVRRGHSVL